MMSKVDKARYYAAQALHYAGEAVMLKCLASVHLENSDDELYWNSMLQKYRPGHYNFIYHSNTAEGSKSYGCTQCLQYSKYLSDKFFICIDSDYRYLRQEPEIISNKYILQTYTYSWENHYCYTERLQNALVNKDPELSRDFDFCAFLSEYSKTIYKPLILFLYMDRNKIKGFSQKKFNELSALQFRAGDIADNGKNVNLRLASMLNPLVASLESTLTGFDFEREKKYYENLGLNEHNAYLHFRGHNLYNIVLGIGRHLCQHTDVNFENDILTSSLAFDGYWEIERCGEDITSL